MINSPVDDHSENIYFIVTDIFRFKHCKILAIMNVHSPRKIEIITG